MWRGARVDKLIKSRDGNVRSCVLRLDGKELTPPIQINWSYIWRLTRVRRMSGSRIITDNARCANKQLKEEITVTLILLCSTIQFSSMFTC
ncbi:hypothetical protein AVEN_273494-1 [Araneus ventricosus]|uniref:DUF5641 domain-containing protein n=1 Tax=Araneus ventricosus TaxID=182803 RepID=A0A4Y2T0P3_ARAVE|nr:hypothetical protein AVEN_273494-1 [Araneus ventricosus]